MHNQALVIVGVLAFVITAINVGVVCVQAWLSQRNSIEASAQTDRLIANANQIADAMQKSLMQAKEALDATVAISRRDQRAWLAVIGITGSPSVGNPFFVDITVKNNGKTFAKKTKLVVCIFPCQKESNLDFHIIEKAMNEAEGSVSTVAPNADYSTHTKFLVGLANDKITEEQIEKWKTGSEQLFVFGKLTYEDIFGVAHWQSFCMQMNPSLEFNSYHQYNDVDDN